MAQTTQTLRVTLVPTASIGGNINDFFSLPALVDAETNGWYTQLYASGGVYGMLTPPSSMSLQSCMRMEMLTDPTNDAHLVATTLPALQSELGLASPLITWSVVVTSGY